MKNNNRKSVKISLLTLTQLPQVLDLIDQYDRAPATRPTSERLQQVFQSITANGGAVIGAVDDQQVIGTCTLNVCDNLSWSAKPYAIIENVIVDDRYRGSGIGKQILAAATDKARELGCYKVALMTGSKRTETLGFYESAGFEPSKTGFQIRF